MLPHSLRWIHLLFFSCVFYCFFIPAYLLILAGTILIDYAAARLMEHSSEKVRKIWLIASIVSTCLVLIVFKYYNFFTESFASVAHILGLKYSIGTLSIILPIGLSFHTFQSLSYVIEVYKGNQKAEKHLGVYALYVMFYPQLVAGPIERPQNMLHQFYERHHFSYQNLVIGLKLMLWGFFKKVVIADRLSVYVDSVYSNQEYHNGTTLIVATVFFTFQIYCDFSGYSDIAIGSARIMGFKLMTNFNRPYFAKSISEFWKRWHISLSTWFRDYVYVPLGGSRVSIPWVSFNLLITFCISGLWHGANWTFVIWGALNGVYLVIAKIWRSYHRPLKGHILTTFILVVLSWVFFRSDSTTEALSILKKMTFDHGRLFWGDSRTFIYGTFFLIILLIVEAFEEYKLMNSFSLFNHQSWFVRRSSYLIVILLILMFGVFDNNQFIYFQF